MRQPIILHGTEGGRLIFGPGFTVVEHEDTKEVYVSTCARSISYVVETFDEIARAVDAMHVLEDDDAKRRVEKAGGPAQEAGLVAPEVPTELIDTYNAARRALLEVPLTDPDAPSPAYNTARAAVLATAPTAAEVATALAGAPRPRVCNGTCDCGEPCDIVAGHRGRHICGLVVDDRD